MCVCECECEMRGCVGASEIDGESEETKRNSAFRLDSSPRTRLKMETMNLCTRDAATSEEPVCLTALLFGKRPGLLFSVE